MNARSYRQAYDKPAVREIQRQRVARQVASVRREAQRLAVRSYRISAACRAPGAANEAAEAGVCADEAAANPPGNSVLAVTGARKFGLRNGPRAERECRMSEVTR